MDAKPLTPIEWHRRRHAFENSIPILDPTDIIDEVAPVTDAQWDYLYQRAYGWQGYRYRCCE